MVSGATSISAQPAGVSVLLTPFEQDYCAHLARERNAKSRRGFSRKIDPRRSDMDIELDGVSSELMVAKYLDTQLDAEIYKHGDPGFDLVFCGWTVDVKSSHHYPNTYLYTKGGTLKADCAWLVLLRDHPPSHGTILGAISKARFMRLQVVVYWGKGNRGVHHTVLTPPQLSKQKLLANPKPPSWPISS